MRRFAQIAVLITAASVCACAGGPSAPIEHRAAEGAQPNIEYRSPASQRPAATVPQAGEVTSSREIAASRIVSPPPAAGGSGPAVVLPERPTSVVVQPGDTLFMLTERYRVGLEQVIAANRLEEPYTLYAGSTLILPQWPTYTVREGDTISDIALAANIDMPSLLLLNYIPDPDNLRPGQVLILPELPGGGLGPSAAAPAGSRPPSTAPAQPPAAQQPPETAVTTTAAATGPGGRFVWPLQGEIISDFGPKARGQRNDGVNIRADEGDPVKAAAAGNVVYAGNELAGYGELLLVRHDDGWITAYAHNRRLLVAEGDRVSAGQTIAEVGSTGSVTSPQLHFEVRDGVDPVDPMLFLPPGVTG
jgi:murein DD-endopeptidase MepM/ murein hydrolase activator NlpD